MIASQSKWTKKKRNPEAIVSEYPDKCSRRKQQGMSITNAPTDRCCSKFSTFSIPTASRYAWGTVRECSGTGTCRKMCRGYKQVKQRAKTRTNQKQVEDLENRLKLLQLNGTSNTRTCIKHCMPQVSDHEPICFASKPFVSPVGLWEVCHRET